MSIIVSKALNFIFFGVAHSQCFFSVKKKVTPHKKNQNFSRVQNRFTGYFLQNFSRAFTGYSKISRVFFSVTFCFPQNSRSCSVRRVFFTDDVLVANSKNTLVVLGGKVQNMTCLIPKAVMTKTDGTNRKAPKRHLRRERQTTEWLLVGTATGCN